MFEEHYPYEKCGKRIPNISSNDPLKEIHIYRFDAPGYGKYLVEIYRFDLQVMVIKFCLRKNWKYPKRYEWLANEKFTSLLASRVIRTIFKIAQDILENEPQASFAFIGVPKSRTIIYKKNANTFESKDKPENQRFRFYRQVVGRFIGGENFDHSYEENLNAYLLTNKKNTNKDNLRDEIISMFVRKFPDFGLIQ
jgi:hypothetical protein